MIRSFTWLLIVSLLALNMAWAIDACAFNDPPGWGTDVAQTFDPAPADSTGNLPACNHWCPGWTSVVTLPASSVLLPSLLSTFDGGLGTDLYFFLPTPPPTHPPIG